MPRIPKYCRNGLRAYVTLSGKRIYLGKYNSETSKAEYNRLVAEWLSGKSQIQYGRSSEVLLTHVMLAYLKWAKTYYENAEGKEPGSVSTTKAVIKLLRDHYGHQPAHEFGPRAFKTIIEQMLKRDWSRKYINELIGRVKHMMKWAASEELIEFETYHRITTVGGIRKGKTTAREPAPILPISDAVIEQTIQFLPPIIADMVRLQLLTGMRPGELCTIRPYDIKRTTEIWIYLPQKHKTEHHGIKRTIYIGLEGQSVLLPYLLRADEAYCFSPAESEKKRLQLRHQERTTPLRQGNHPGSNKKKKPTRKPKEKYTTTSYRRAIRRACESAKVPTWSPNQLRHTAATRIRKEFGLEATQAILGHNHLKTTEIYAEKNQELAIKVMSKIG